MPSELEQSAFTMSSHCNQTEMLNYNQTFNKKKMLQSQVNAFCLVTIVSFLCGRAF